MHRSRLPYEISTVVRVYDLVLFRLTSTSFKTIFCFIFEVLRFWRLRVPQFLAHASERATFPRVACKCLVSTTPPFGLEFERLLSVQVSYRILAEGLLAREFV